MDPITATFMLPLIKCFAKISQGYLFQTLYNISVDFLIQILEFGVDIFAHNTGRIGTVKFPAEIGLLGADINISQGNRWILGIYANTAALTFFTCQ
ncbi:hypothetical protein D3C72_1638900 [compost metagenome]